MSQRGDSLETLDSDRESDSRSGLPASQIEVQREPSHPPEVSSPSSIASSPVSASSSVRTRVAQRPEHIHTYFQCTRIGMLGHTPPRQALEYSFPCWQAGSLAGPRCKNC